MRWQSSISLLGFWLVFGYFLLLPLVQPRGIYGWGHYRGIDVLAGVALLPVVTVMTALHLGRKRGSRKVAVRLAALFIAVYGTLAVSDAAYTVYRMSRWSWWHDERSIPRDGTSLLDPELGFIRKPEINWHGHVPSSTYVIDYHADEHGFRNADGIKAASVVFIGDSFTEATEVPNSQTFARLVAKDAGLSVVNLGRAGYGPAQELTVLKKWGLPYRPRFIVWQIFEGNDLEDDAKLIQWKRDPNSLRPSSIVGRYVASSELVRLVRETKPRIKTVARMGNESGPGRPLSLTHAYEPDAPVKFRQGMESVQRSIADAARLCHERGIRLLILLVPIRERIIAPYITFNSPSEQNRMLPGGGKPRDGDFASQMARICRENHCGFIDLYGIFTEGQGQNKTIYLPHDPHLDMEGHKVIAKEVVSWIRSEIAKQGQTPSDD